jgi:hypothetical protein
VRARIVGRNGPAELLTGNHDPALSDAHWVYDAESQTLIFHGDCVLDCTHPTKKTEQFLMGHLRARWAQLGGRPADFVELHENYRSVQRQWLPIINPYKKAKTVTQYALSLVYPPRRPFDIVHYWLKAPGRVLELARGFGKPLRHVVVGHTHRAGCWIRGGVKVMNTGSYMPISASYAVVLDGEQAQWLSVKTLTARRNQVLIPKPDIAAQR